MDDYTLCSSSTEQGEIPVIKVKRFKARPPVFPTHMSYMKYMYLPGTSLFVGENSVPRSCDYHPNTLTTGLKRRLKQDLPYPFSCITLNGDKPFFENGFVLRNRIKAVPVSLELVETRGDVRVVSEEGLQHIKEARGDRYKEICGDFMSGRLLNCTSSEKCIKILIRDSMLNTLKNKRIYTHFTVQSKDEGLYVVFDKTYSIETRYYEYLDRYGEEVVKSLDSSEIRIYSNKDVKLVVCSFTTFSSPCGTGRLFSGVDVDKSISVVVNMDDVRIVRCLDTLDDELHILLGIEFKEGEYVINQGMLYEVNPNGERFAFNNFSFSGFLEEPEG